METEEFRSGFCKSQNQTRMVVLTFEVKTDGTKDLLETDCAYGTCAHTGDCLLMKHALEE